MESIFFRCMRVSQFFSLAIIYINTAIFHLWQILSTVAVISVNLPLFTAAIIPLVIIYYFMLTYYIATSRQLKRLESVSRSPIYTHFGETLTGAHIIRASGETERFIRESEDKVDSSQKCFFAGRIAYRYNFSFLRKKHAHHNVFADI